MRSPFRAILSNILAASAGMLGISPTHAGEDAGTVRSEVTESEEALAAQPLWSLRPVSRRPPRRVHGDHFTGPIDAYIIDQLRRKDLRPSDRAAAYHQIRRLSLLLTGLPPTPAEARAFARNPSDAAYTRLVDRYLQSPHFGERWARHWMDVVRFAETYGYEWNFLIRDAWRYRDYLIRAFNQDVPYDQLVREHIAGDLLETPRIDRGLGINESLIGTAFYRFGETGHDDCTLYPDISLDVIDNQIDTMFKAFQALTVSCARCHDHKLDAISQRDYYAMLGILSSSRQVIHDLDLPGRQFAAKERLRRLKSQIREELARLWSDTASTVAPDTLNAVASSEGDPAPDDPLFAWRSLQGIADGPAWTTQRDVAERQVVAEQLRRAAFNREKFEVLADFTAGLAHPAWAIEGDAAEGGFARAGDFSVRFDGETVLDRVLPAGFYSHLISQRLTATLRSPILPKHASYISYYGVGEHNSACRTVLDNCQLAYFHTNWFNQPRFSWFRTDLAALARHQTYFEWATLFENQGYPNLSTSDADYRKSLANPRSYFGVTRVLLHEEAVEPLPELRSQLAVWDEPFQSREALAGRYRDVLVAAVAAWSRDQASESDVFWINFFLDAEVLPRHFNASPRLSSLTQQFRVLESQLEMPQLIVGMADQGPGFDVPIFVGGDPGQPGEAASRAFLACLQDVVGSERIQGGSGRAALARDMANPRNPLTARVMVNRIWHHLFGTGLVKSVDNFGAIGDPPSHPELLDYLARRFVDSGWSMKRLIREIVLSDTFRQSSTIDPAAAIIDPQNTLLHHFPARRLEAEVIRDSLLAVSGRIDSTMYGPSIDPHRGEEIESRRLFSGPLDGAGRRSLYLKVTRMGPSKLLALFNLPDPGMTVGRRDSTNVPAQALGLLNHPMIHQLAEAHARRMLHRNDADFVARVDSLFMELFARPPTTLEMDRCAQLFARLAANRDGTWNEIHDVEVWQALIHTLYNLKEFVYVL